MTQDRTRYERRGNAAWITLDSPENRNALSAPLVAEQLGPSIFRHTWTAPTWPYINPAQDAATCFEVRGQTPRSARSRSTATRELRDTRSD